MPLDLIGRTQPLFTEDLRKYKDEISHVIGNSSFLVIGGAGSIGQAVTKEIFVRNPKKLHVVDISENNLVELVRDLRSSLGYTSGDFQTFALDIGSDIFDSYLQAQGKFDYVLNLSALKHVRSEKDPFTLMRMIDVNIFNTDKTIRQFIEARCRKYFCVSTDKAANPVNMMGASKRIMEMFLMRRSQDIPISTARFANVAFSDGSLLHGFNMRIQKRQPIVAPNDIRRYFVTPKESGELCLMSVLFGENRDIYFPKLSEKLHLVTFAEIAERYLASLGYEPYLCDSEEQARALTSSLPKEGKWPCLFTPSDTTGEKDFEEFFTDQETLDLDKFEAIGVIKNPLSLQKGRIEEFERRIQVLRTNGKWSRDDLVELFRDTIPNFSHKETGKFLDAKM